MSPQGVTRDEFERLLDERLAPFRQLISQLQGTLSSAPIEAKSSVAEAFGATSADVQYNSIVLTLTPGKWLIAAQATVGSDVTDGKQLGIWNATAGGPLANSKGPAVDCVGGGYVGLTTVCYTESAVNVAVKMIAYRNGASQSRIGYPFGGLSEHQRITAVRVGYVPGA